MIRINLLPPELKRKRREIELPNISFLPVLSIFVGTLAAIYILAALFTVLEVNKLSRLEKRWDAIAPQQKEVDGVKRQILSLEQKIATIEEIISWRPLWAARLKALSDSMITGVWLRRIWLETKYETIDTAKPQARQGKGAKPAGGQPAAETQKKTEVKTTRIMHIEGSVITSGGDETAAIGRFIRSLKSNEEFSGDFSEIETGSIQRGNLDDVELMNFELLAFFKEDRR